jgi:hypothetical protein
MGSRSGKLRVKHLSVRTPWRHASCLWSQMHLKIADLPTTQTSAEVRECASMLDVRCLWVKSCVGTLCVLDVRPRQLSDAQVALLKDVAALVERELQQRPY